MEPMLDRQRAHGRSAPEVQPMSVNPLECQTLASHHIATANTFIGGAV